MFKAFDNLPEWSQGLIALFTGITMLLYVLGYVEKGITLIIIGVACYLIALGAVKSGLYQKIMQLLSKGK